MDGCCEGLYLSLLEWRISCFIAGQKICWSKAFGFFWGENNMEIVNLLGEERNRSENVC